MPTQAIIPVTPGSGLDLDAVSLVIGPNTVFREVLVIADPSNATYLATVNSDGTLNVALPSAQTPPSAAAIGTAVATDLLIGTQVAGSSVPVALPTATITALTPPTAAAIAAAIVANPPAVTVTGNVSVIGTDADNAANSTTKVPTIPARANASAPSWTEGHEVPLSVDLAGNLRVLASGAFTGNITEWNTTSLGSPTAFGTEPSGNVIGVNAEVFQGSSVVGSGNALYVQFPSAQAVTGTFFQATQPVSIASGQVASGAFASGSIASGAIASGALASGAIAAGAAAAGAFADGSVFVRSNAAATFPVTAIGTLTHNNAAPTTNNIGALVGVASAGAPTYTTGDQVLLSTDLSGNLRTTGTFTGTITGAVTGTLTNNNAAPSTNNLGVLPALANAADPTWTEGDLVTASVTLGGYQRVILHAETTKVIGTVNAVGTLTHNNAAPAANNLGVLPALANAVSPLWTEGDQVLESVDLHGGQRIIGGNIPEITAAWTSATGANTALTLTPILGYSAIVVTLSGTSTITGGGVTFEVSDTAAGTNWYSINGLITTPGGALSVSEVLSLSATNTSITVSVGGWAAFRVRLSTMLTGTGTLTVGIQAGEFPAAPSAITLAAGQLIGVRSTSASATFADNQLNQNFFASNGGINETLAVSDAVYGGAFSGTPNATLQGWSKMRASTVFRTVQVNASTTGNSAVWTPGSGNKFRLLRFQITAQGLAATATGVVTVSFQDNVTGIPIGTYDVDVPAVANVVSGTDNISGGWIDLGAFGVLSAAANNVLNFNISAAGAGTAGTYRINVAGTEE